MNFILLFLLASTVASEPSEPPVSDEQEQQDSVLDEDVEDCQEGVEDLKNSILGLEFYLRDKKNHKKFCPHIEWNQPKLETYKKDPKSYLPSECKLKE